MMRVRTENFSCPYFLGIGLKTGRFTLGRFNLRIQSKRGKIRTRKTTNTETFTQCLGLGLVYAHFLGTSNNYVVHFLGTSMAMKIEKNATIFKRVKKIKS